MIHPTDVASVATQRLSVVVPVWTSETRSSAATWFEPGAGDVSIVGGVSAGARGLSVEEHSQRVLMHLRGERDAPV